MKTLETKTTAAISCPKCGCNYTYGIGYGIMECPECLNTWNYKQPESK